MDQKQLTKFAIDAGFAPDGKSLISPFVEDADLTHILAQFAEQIVRECATLAYEGPNGILDHFGVTDPWLPAAPSPDDDYDSGLYYCPYDQEIDGVNKVCDCDTKARRKCAASI